MEPDREPLLREDFAAPLDLRAAPDLLADERLAPEAGDLAREDADLVPLRLDRALLPELFAAPLVDRFAELRLALPERDPALRGEEEAELEPRLEPDVSPHLPDITRWAASATASAISAPNLVALDITLVAACEAVSAASRPASRIFLRAAGLALIAAAAAARPAASISLLIAAFASLSTVLSPPLERDEDLDFDDEERVFRADLAIVYLPPLLGKTLQGRSGSRMMATGAPRARTNM